MYICNRFVVFVGNNKHKDKFNVLREENGPLIMIKTAWRLFLLTSIISVGALCLAASPAVAQASPDPIPAPTVINIAYPGSEYQDRPLISGLTKANTEVLVYANGEFWGLAHLNRSEGPTHNFYFQPSYRLAEGSYDLTFIARDKDSLRLSVPSPARQIRIFGLSAPILVTPNSETVTAKVKPLISGLTRSQTRVHIFIDGLHNGQTDFVADNSPTADFVYEPFLNLSVGEHRIWAIAEDKAGNKSPQSDVQTFTIESPFPAPILFSPLAGTDPHRPLIRGLAKNNSTIRVFIDKKLYGEFPVKNHESGTASFVYEPFLPLSPGDHLVYVSAVDERGKESRWSNIVYKQIKDPATDSTDNSDFKEDLALAEALDDNQDGDPVEVKGEEGGVNEENGTISESGVNEEIRDIINGSAADSGETSGAINEAKENQGKLRWNLAIFLLFLLAVIAWIFWVNRELIKERQNREKDQK